MLIPSLAYVRRGAHGETFTRPDHSPSDWLRQACSQLLNQFIAGAIRPCPHASELQFARLADGHMACGECVPNRPALPGASRCDQCRQQLTVKATGLLYLAVDGIAVLSELCPACALKEGL